MYHNRRWGANFFTQMENMKISSVLGRIRINEKEMTVQNISSLRMACPTHNLLWNFDRRTQALRRIRTVILSGSSYYIGSLQTSCAVYQCYNFTFFNLPISLGKFCSCFVYLLYLISFCHLSLEYLVKIYFTFFLLNVV